LGSNLYRVWQNISQAVVVTACFIRSEYEQAVVKYCDHF